MPIRRRWFWKLLATVAAGAWLVGILIWCCVRDRWPVTAPLFYALPLPLLAISAIVAGECFRKLARRRLAAMAYLATATTVLNWLPTAVVFRAETPPKDAIKLLFWNVNRGNLGYEAIAADILSYNPDLVALVEATGSGQDPTTWKRSLPGYAVHKLGSGMMLLIRGELREMEPGMLRESLKYRVMRVKLAQGEFALTLVDIASDPLLSRRPAFEKVKELTIRHPKLPHIIAGDFNTPPDSELFNLLPAEYSHAFAAKGSGYRETWPTTSPVLCLDQVWGDRAIVWHRCIHGWSLRSDHRPVIAEFSLK